MTPEEILTAFKTYAFEQLELFIPATDQGNQGRQRYGNYDNRN